MLGDDYITLTELKSYLKLELDDRDAELSDAIEAASRTIELHCDRQFNNAGGVSTRTFRPLNKRICLVDDFHTTTGLVIETSSSSDGVFDTTWAADQYELRPSDGVRNGLPGWPYWQIVAVDNEVFPRSRLDRSTVRVTANWGWAEVPKPVAQACRIVAAENYQLRDSRLGIAGSDQFGQIVRLRDNGIAIRKLAPFVRGRSGVA